MTRLGSVVGAVLAELTRARAISDELTRELVERYEADPILASLSVPRVSLGQAEIAIRFVVSDIEEPKSTEPDADAAREAWISHFSSVVLPTLVERANLQAEERRQVLAVLAGANDKEEDAPVRVVVRPPLGDVRAALTGEQLKLVSSTVGPVAERFDSLPAALKRKLGGKVVFTDRLTTVSTEGLASVLRARARADLITSALASTVNISVTSDALSADSDRLQELRLTIHSDDLDTVLGEREGE